jgi:hypothetical protein
MSSVSQRFFITTKKEGKGVEEAKSTYPSVIIGAQEIFSCWLPDNRINRERHILA